jgi:branched-chain amino acid transport system permease protein
MSAALRRNRGRAAIFAALAFIFLSGLFTMDAGDWLITVLRGLAVGAITFLVASGLSLIFGLMDVLNLAHGELFMLGAYVGWTVYVRPDTFLDVLLPIAVVATVVLAAPLFTRRLHPPSMAKALARVLAVIAAIAGGLVAVWALGRFPLSIWNLEQFDQTPTADSIALDQGLQVAPPPAAWTGSAVVAISALIVAVLLIVLAFLLLRRKAPSTSAITLRSLTPAIVSALVVVVLLVGGDAITDWMFSISTTWRFFIALAVAAAGGFVAGAGIEVTLIRPLYERPIYQLMITLVLGFIIIEVVREIWGRPEFSMPKPALFAGSGDGCPGQGISGLFSGCSTIEVLGTRVRMYNEVFIITVGIVVVIAITVLIKRTRMGMIIRAGVQDREMVEALGVNVRRVFTIVFALGVGLAAFGGVIAAPALGLSTGMGARVLLLALIAMAIGGLTSFPGAAAGAALVGLVQQFVIKAGSTGIPLPWSDVPFKPSPSLVPVSVIMLMIIVLLVTPEGLFGREE